jgi:hypothetical protein
MMQPVGSHSSIVTILVAVLAIVGCGQSPAAPRAVEVVALSPSSGPVGTSVQITGSGFESSKNVVKFGAGYIGDVTSPDGTMLRFTVPARLDLCPPADLQSNAPCGDSIPAVRAGAYPVSVVTRNGATRELTFRVTG